MAEIILETERLILRTRDERDMDDWVRHLNTPAVMRHLGGPQEMHQIEAGFARMDALQARYGHSFWIVQRKSDAALLGMCGLKRFDNRYAPMTGEFEIGWRLREDVWGQGIAREAAAATLEHAFLRLDAPHVIAMTSEANIGSWRLMEKLGMKRRQDLDFDDPDFPPHENPTIIYRIDRQDWQA